MALAPLRQFGLKTTLITTHAGDFRRRAIRACRRGTFSATSFPHIGGGEEEKIETETKKILGSLGRRRRRTASGRRSARRRRGCRCRTGTPVPSRSASTQKPSLPTDRRRVASFRGRPQALELPSAPPQPIVYLDEANRPQPALDVDRDGGMTVSRRPPPAAARCSATSSSALGHNTIRGAAGAAILNAELMHRRGPAVNGCHEVRRHVGRRCRRHRTASSAIVRQQVAVARCRRAGRRSSSSRRLAAYRSARRCRRGSRERRRRRARRRRPAGPRATGTSRSHRQSLRARRRRRCCWRSAATSTSSIGLVRALSVLREVSPRCARRGARRRRARRAAVSWRRRSREQKVPATWVDSRTVVVTDAEHTGAAPDMAATRERAQQLLAPHRARAAKCRCSADSSARRASGVTTTLGRGGSDYSAAIFGACLDVGRDPDLDRRRRHADGRSARRAASGSGAAAFVCRGVRARVLRRQGSAPGTILPAVASNIPGADSQFAAPGKRGHAHHRAGPAADGR